MHVRCSILKIMWKSLCVFWMWSGLGFVSTPSHAQKHITIRASATYKKSAEYKLVKKFIRYRGFQLTQRYTNGTLCIVRYSTRRVCIHNRYKKQLFRFRTSVRHPELRARTLLLYLNIFLQNRSNRVSNRTFSSCRCSLRRRPPRKKKQLPKAPQKRPPTRPKVRPSPPVRPRTRSKKEIPDLTDPLPSFGPSRRTSKKQKTTDKRTLWGSIGLAAESIFQTPHTPLPGGVLWIRLGWNDWSVQGNVHIHPVRLQTQRYITRVRPSFWIDWSPTFGSSVLQNTVGVGLQLGTATELFLEEPGPSNQEYKEYLEWGLTIGIQGTWYITKQWGLFVRGGWIFYPGAGRFQKKEGIVHSPSAPMQFTASLGIRYRWTFFEKK